MEIFGIPIPGTKSGPTNSPSTIPINDDSGLLEPVVDIAVAMTKPFISAVNKAKELTSQGDQKVKAVLNKHIDDAILAKEAYKDGPSKNLPHGYTEVEQFRRKSKNGLKCKVFRRVVNGRVELKVVYAGTNPIDLRDWINNVSQAKGLSSQYDEAVEIAKELDNYCKEKGHDLTFIGHSQGGGQAALASMKTGRKAVTFNPAGVSKDTKIKHGIDPNRKFNNQIKAFITEKDPLNLAQDAYGEALGLEADGERHYIKSSDGALTHHGMDAVIRDMKKMRDS